MNATKEGFRVFSTLWMPSAPLCKPNVRKHNCVDSALFRRSCSRKLSVADGNAQTRPNFQNQNEGLPSTESPSMFTGPWIGCKKLSDFWPGATLLH